MSILYSIATGNFILSAGGANITLINPVFNGDTTYPTPNGIVSTATQGFHKVKIINGDFGTTSGIKTSHSTADITCPSSNAVGSSLHLTLINTTLSSSTQVVNSTNFPASSFIASQKHNQVAGSHKTWKRNGTLIIETTTTHTGGTALKMTPARSTEKLESNSFYAIVANGASLIPTVYVRKDGSYNGNQPRLILKRNDAIGITSDTVIATATSASNGAWEALSGTTATATDDGAMEFIVDCDGTAGNCFVDSFSIA